MDCQGNTTRSDLERMLFDEAIKPKALPFSLLKEITHNFSDEQEIGRGGFAVVYKGELRHGKVAVKKLSGWPDFDEKRFNEEVFCLINVKHKNIVRFLGYCSDTQGKAEKYAGKNVMADVRQRLLCFEYLPKGTLNKYIKDASREWGKCFQIIKGICKGLHCLHQNRIVHLDLKPTNILLDDNMVPKIADFGLSRCFDENQSQDITSKPCGTLGYWAPELHNGKITFKNDIYSLGVIIIEILTGEKGCRPDVEDVLESWRNKLEKLREDAQLEQIRVCTEIGKECIDEHNPAKRPAIQDIIHRLDETDSTTGCTVTAVSCSIVAQVSSSAASNELILHEQKEAKSTLKIVNKRNEQVPFKYMSLESSMKCEGVLKPRSELVLSVTRLAEEGASAERNETVNVVSEDFMEKGITRDMLRTLTGEIVHKLEQGLVHVGPFRPRRFMVKIVIRVNMPCERCLAKAMKLTASISGVVSMAIPSNCRDQLVVVGEGVDPVCLVTCLRKKLGHADILLVGPGEMKREEPMAMVGSVEPGPSMRECQPVNCTEPPKICAPKSLISLTKYVFFREKSRREKKPNPENYHSLIHT